MIRAVLSGAVIVVVVVVSVVFGAVRFVVCEQEWPI